MQHKELPDVSVISDDEDVVRYLKRRYYDAEEKQWSVNAFELRQGEDYISVCRSQMLSTFQEGIRLSFPESMHKSIVAYAIIGVGTIRALSSDKTCVDVVAKPTEVNPSHAGITTHVENKLVIGVPTNPEYLSLQLSLLNIVQDNIVMIGDAQK